MLTNQTGQYISILKHTNKSLNMANSKEWKTLKHNNNKKTKKDKKEINKISPYGKLLSPNNPNGHLLGDKGGQVGISNVQLWQYQY